MVGATDLLLHGGSVTVESSSMFVESSTVLAHSNDQWIRATLGTDLGKLGLM